MRSCGAQTSQHSADAVADLPGLSARDVIGDRGDIGCTECLKIRAHHASQPRAGFGTAPAPPVRRLAGVLLFCNPAEPSIHVRCHRKMLGSEATTAGAKPYRSEDGAHRRAQTSGVDELTQAKPGKIRVTAGRDAARDYRHNVCGRAADVDEQGIRVRTRHPRCARHPVGGRHVKRPLLRFFG